MVTIGREPSRIPAAGDAVTGGVTVERVCLFSRLARPGLGDLVQRNIFLNLLRLAYPRARLTWVLGAGITAVPFQDELVRRHSCADEIMVCPDAEDTDAEDADSGRWREFADELAGRHFQVCVVDPSTQGLGVRDAWLAAIPVRVAVPVAGPDNRFITHPMRLGRPVLGRHDLYDYAVALATALGVSPIPRPGQVVPRLPMRVRPLPAWASRRPLVGVHPGGAKGWNRRWPLDRFAEVAIRLAAEHDATLLLLGAPDEHDETDLLRAAVLREHPPARVHTSLGEPLNDVANLLAAMDLLLGNDSGPAHLAAALATRTVVIYGPSGTESLWTRIYPAHLGVNLNYPCQNLRHEPTEDIAQCEHGCPCYYQSPAGPYPRCLTDITVADVWQAVLSQLTVPRVNQLTVPRANLGDTVKGD